jgi:hypothetical protein
MREVDSLISEDGGREMSGRRSLPQSFATQNPAPSSEGAIGRDGTCGRVYETGKAVLLYRDRNAHRGGDDPVGGYGVGVRQAAEEFKKSGLEHVETRIYPLGRHEMLNELNKQEVYEHIWEWIKKI